MSRHNITKRWLLIHDGKRIKHYKKMKAHIALAISSDDFIFQADTKEECQAEAQRLQLASQSLLESIESIAKSFWERRLSIFEREQPSDSASVHDNYA